MGRSFRRLFVNEIDYELYDGEDYTRKDFYGDVCKWTNINDVVDWLSDEVKHNDYRRLRPLLGFLNGIDESKWGDLQVVHFGC